MNNFRKIVDNLSWDGSRVINRGWMLGILAYLCLGLAACSGFDPAAVIGQSLPSAGQAQERTVTLTPFQPSSPTTRPTFTLTPTITLAPAPTSSPTSAACQEQHGRIEAKEEVVRQGRPQFVFRVYFPPCFVQGPPARYPVLYMIHGQTFTDDQWERLGIGAAADDLIDAKEARPFLIVMPLEKDTYEDMYRAGFSRDVTDGLIPWIDANYPTCAERQCRAIGGLSRGGAWALHLGFTRWNLFGAVGMHSTPPFNTDPNLFPIWLRDIPADQLPRVWMDTGRRDAFQAMTSAFEEELVRYDVPHEWYLNNGMHEESYWTAHVKEYLEWYTRPWKDLPYN